MKRKILSLLSLFIALVAYGQQDNENEFQRIAQRIMDSHETGNLTFSDSLVAPGAWHGGYYLGAASNGRTLPSASFTYKKGNLTFSGNLALDRMEKTQGKIDETLANDGSGRTMWTDIHTNAQKLDGSVELDYALNATDLFSFSILEQYNTQDREEEANAEYYDEGGRPFASSITEQTNRSHDLAMDMLLQWKHHFPDRSMLTMRANAKYNSRGIDVDFTDWSREGTPTLDEAALSMNGRTPIGEVQYTSRQWAGFSFLLGDKYMYEKVDIDNDDTAFSYDALNNISTFGLNFNCRKVKLSARTSYNDFSRKIDAERKHYRDWLTHLGADWTITQHHRLSLTYDKNVKRPSYLLLYPYRHLESSLGTYYVGNPNLEPAQIHQLKAIYTYDHLPSLKISFTAGYERIQDDLTQVTGEAQNNEGSFKTWVNDALYNNFNMAIDGQWQWGILDLRWHIRPRYIDYQAEHANDYSNWSWNFKLRPELSLPYGWKVASALYFQGAEHKLTTFKRSYTYFSLRAVKDFGNWSIYAFYQDIFEQDRVETVYGAHSQVTTRRDQNDGAVIAGFSYTF